MESDGKFLDFIISYFGQILFFGVDIILLLLLDDFYRLESGFHKISRNILFPLIFLGFSNISFLFGKNLNFLLVFHLIIMIYLTYDRQRNWTVPLTYLSLVVAPMGALMGLDPIWGNSFSLFKMSVLLRGDQFVILGIIILMYLWVKRKNISLQRLMLRLGLNRN